MSQDNIFREVDEELRGDRMRTLWRRFGPYLIAAAVGVVLIVGVKEGWDWFQAGNAANSSEQFYEALELSDGTDLAAAQGALNEVIAANHGGYPILARFKQAELLAREGKPMEAVAAYDALATNQSNQLVRELALVLAANILVDNGSLSDVQARVGGLDNPESPLRNAAREALGLAYYKAGDLDAARRSFESITADPRASADLQGRMRIYLGQLISEGAAPPEDAATSPDPSAGAPVETNPEAGLPPVEVPAEQSSAPAEPAAESAAEPAAPGTQTAPAN